MCTMHVSKLLKNYQKKIKERKTSHPFMSEVKKKSFVRVPTNIYHNLLFDKTLTKRQIKILLLIIRFSFGCHNEEAVLKNKDFRIVNLYHTDIKKEINKLVQKEKIGKKENSFWITSYFSRKLSTRQEKQLSELLSRNLVKH